MKRSSVTTRPDFPICRLSLPQGQVLGEGNHALQERIVFLQPLQIHSGQIQGADFPRANQLGQSGHRPEGHVFQVGGGGPSDRGAHLEGLTLGVQVHVRESGIELKAGSVAVSEGDIPQFPVTLKILIDPSYHGFSFWIGEFQTGQLLCTDHHLLGDRWSLLLLHFGPQDTGQESRRQPQAREIGQEIASGQKLCLRRL